MKKQKLNNYINVGSYICYQCTESKKVLSGEEIKQIREIKENRPY